MRSVFVDTSVLLVAVGGEHSLRDASRRLLVLAQRGQVRIHLSVEAGQEFLFHRMRRAGLELALRQFDALDRLVVWHPYDVETLHRARDLVSLGTVRGRDAVHAATALIGGFGEIVSFDTDFDRIPGLRRVEPTSLEDRSDDGPDPPPTPPPGA